MYLAELENTGVSFCFLARDDGGRAVGFCSFWRVLDELHINNLAVLPDLRRAGIGSTLLEFVLKKGVELGAAPGHPRGAALERGGAAAVRAVRLRGGRRARGLLLEAGRGRAGAVARGSAGISIADLETPRGLWYVRRQ